MEKKIHWESVDDLEHDWRYLEIWRLWIQICEEKKVNAPLWDYDVLATALFRRLVREQVVRV